MPNNLVAALIMKDEEDVAARCIESIRPHVRYTMVSDTGSTDGTVAVLAYAGAWIMEDKWVDFATNRNNVLRAAEKDANAAFILCGIDADEILHVPENYAWPTLANHDGWYIECRLNGMHYKRLAIVRNGHWEWRGVIHEALVPLVANATTGTIPDVWIEVRTDGARSKDPNTQKKDLAVLQQAVENDHLNARYRFYLAQTYRDLGMHLEAHDSYVKRANMAGWQPETAYAWYQAGRMAEFLGIGDADYYMKAFDLDPTRAEYMVAAASFYRRQEGLTIATIFAGIASMLPVPKDGLFVETDVYEWRALDEFTTTGFYTTMREQAAFAAKLLLQRKFPETERARIEKNCAFYAEIPQ